MVRATIRRALGGILRRSELLERICGCFPSDHLLGFTTRVAYLEECGSKENDETDTRWNRVEMAPKRHGNKSDTRKSRCKCFFLKYIFPMDLFITNTIQNR